DVDISVQQLLEDIVTVRAISRWISESLPRAESTPEIDDAPTRTAPANVEDAIAALAEHLLELDAGTIDRGVPLL
ncbi:hypothetical protein, partial [Actinokineospora pegani]|uniref:hypothetical protein n=1 Tax=Actinokineospora pegani TaxID=2654637 RepID=UPI0018D28E26